VTMTRKDVAFVRRIVGWVLVVAGAMAGGRACRSARLRPAGGRLHDLLTFVLGGTCPVYPPVGSCFSDPCAVHEGIRIAKSWSRIHLSVGGPTIGLPGGGFPG